MAAAAKGGAKPAGPSTKLRELLASSEFLAQVPFRNSLPTVPSGPFFKKIDILHSHEDFAKYNFSSLEKSYIWQPHFGPDVNMRLNLVDQEAILRHDPYSAEAKRETKEYTSGTTSGGVDLRKKETRQKHWWLRETVYSENNILRNRSAGGDEGASSANVDEGIDPFTAEAIQQSFENIKNAVEILGDKVEWSIPILPDAVLSMDQYAYIKFDESPVLDESQTAQSSESGGGIGKKRNRQSIVTNIRESKSKKGSGDNTYAVSLVTPPESATTTAEGEEQQGGVEAVDYQWTKDFRMVMKNKDWNDHVVFLIDPADGNAKYFQVGVNMEMDKLHIDEVDPHVASVQRREEEEDEEEVGDAEAGDGDGGEQDMEEQGGEPEADGAMESAEPEEN